VQRKRKRGFNNIVDNSAKQNNTRRIVTGFITGWLIFGAICAGGYILAVVVGAFMYFAIKEYAQILQHKGFQPSCRIIYFITFLLFVASVAHLEFLIPIVLFLGLVLSFCAVLFKLRQPYIANISTTVFGFILCWLPCYIYLLRGLGAPGKGFLTLFSNNPGLFYIIMLFFTILVTDIAAYFFGKRYGKHQLSPEVSPKKTVEGCVAGSVAAVLVSVYFGFCLGLPFWKSVLTGALITFFAQLGDLSESMLKRDAGVKDSGNSLPGHGGFLDRADSYILSAPFAYFYFKYFVIADSSPFLQLVGDIHKALSNVGLF